MPRAFASAICVSLVFIAACTTTSKTLADRHDGYEVPIARDVILTLPKRPGLAEPFSESQTLIGNYDGQTKAFQAHVTSEPDKFSVVLLTVSGPRIMNIDWTADGIEQERFIIAPDELDALNILADIFLVRWPEGIIRAALPAGAELKVSETSRMVERDDMTLVEIDYGLEDNKGRSYNRLVNHER